MCTFLKKTFFISVISFTIFSCTNTAKKEITQSIDSQEVNSQKKLTIDTIKTVLAIPKISVFEQAMLDAGLVEVQSLDSTIMVEMKYSTTDNFMETDVYGDFSKAFLQKKAAEKLVKASEILQKNKPDYRLLIYDAARPARVQQILWDTLKVPLHEKHKYVADPKEGSIHNYGCAVDITIFDKITQKSLDMGTKYDFFGKLAYPTKENYYLKTGELSKEQVENRKLLRRVMQQAGYQEIETEWWHFNAFSRKNTKNMYKIVE